MKEKKKKPKLIFIDTSVFINCAMEEFEGLDLDILQEILSKLDIREMILIVPEIIQTETINALNERFSGFRDSIGKELDFSKTKNNGKKSQLKERILNDGKESALKKVSQESKKTLRIIKKIFNHKNTKIVRLNKEIVIAGLTRALLMKRPYTPIESKQKKSTFSKDQDCVSFESVLYFLKTNKKYHNTSFIICVNDSDYLEDGKKKKLHPDIVQDISIKRLQYYISPLEMLEKEFSKEYTKEQTKKYKDIERYSIADTAFVSQAISPHLSVFESMSFVNDESYLSSSISLLGDQSLKIPDTSKFCPKCGENIEDIVIKYKNDLFAINICSYSNSFNCPCCRTQLKIRN